ncbi:MAG: flagellar basal body rod C-terminal domain-containing protein [Caulobacteraceae bacterium]|nr:flagellar basal body rod C-terminal domain-containing protein [Caulobacteraceae bacterium]
MNAISTAATGVLNGLARFDSASSTLVKSLDGQSNADPASAVVDQITAQQQVQASAATLAVSDRMFKRLLDITA